jgi:hypothetical protein
MCVTSCRRLTVKLLLLPHGDFRGEIITNAQHLKRMVSISMSQSGFWRFAVCIAVSLLGP